MANKKPLDMKLGRGFLFLLLASFFAVPLILISGDFWFIWVLVIVLGSISIFYGFVETDLSRESMRYGAFYRNGPVPLFFKIWSKKFSRGTQIRDIVLAVAIFVAFFAWASLLIFLDTIHNAQRDKTGSKLPVQNVQLDK